MKRVHFKIIALYDHLRAIHLVTFTDARKIFALGWNILRDASSAIYFCMGAPSYDDEHSTDSPKRGIISEDHFFAFRDETRERDAWDNDSSQSGLCHDRQCSRVLLHYFKPEQLLLSEMIRNDPKWWLFDWTNEGGFDGDNSDFYFRGMFLKSIQFQAFF